MKKRIQPTQRACRHGQVAAILGAGLVISSVACSSTDKGLYVSQKDAQEMGGISNYVTREEKKQYDQRVADARAQQDALASAAAAPAAAPQESAEKKAQDAISALRNELYFETDSAALRPAAQAPLADVGRYLAQNPDKKVRIEGFTDSTGAKAHNEDLSNRRAEAVAECLKQYGAKDNQVTVLGLGDNQPIASNKSDEGRAMNRRVELHVLTATTATG